MTRSSTNLRPVSLRRCLEQAPHGLVPDVAIQIMLDAVKQVGSMGLRPTRLNPADVLIRPDGSVHLAARVSLPDQRPISSRRLVHAVCRCLLEAVLGSSRFEQRVIESPHLPRMILGCPELHPEFKRVMIMGTSREAQPEFTLRRFARELLGLMLGATESRKSLRHLARTCSQPSPSEEVSLPSVEIDQTIVLGSSPTEPAVELTTEPDTIPSADISGLRAAVLLPENKPGTYQLGRARVWSSLLAFLGPNPGR